MTFFEFCEILRILRFFADFTFFYRFYDFFTDFAKFCRFLFVPTTHCLWVSLTSPRRPPGQPYWKIAENRRLGHQRNYCRPPRFTIYSCGGFFAEAILGSMTFFKILRNFADFTFFCLFYEFLPILRNFADFAKFCLFPQHIVCGSP